MKIKGKIVAVVITVVFAVIFLSSTYTLKENEFGLIKQFGKVVETKQDAGLYFKKPFIQSVMNLPKDEQLYDLASSDVITSDKKSMIADCYVVWQIIDPLKYYQTLKSTSNAESRIDILVYNSMKNVISSMTQSDIIAARGQELTNLIMGNLASINQYGIVISSVEIKLLDLPEDNKDAVFERMISERGNIAATYTAEGNSEAQVIRNTTDKETALLISEAEKEAEILKAEGEAQYMEIMADAYKDEMRADFYSFTRSLDAVRNAITGGNKTIILDKSSPITQIFY